MVESFRRFSWVFVFLALSACSTGTSLVTRWHDPGYQGPPIKKMLVIGVFRDDLTRRMFEDEYVGALNAMGRQGVASYTVMPDLERMDDEARLKAIVGKTGADAVLITTFKGVDKRKTHVPPRTDWVPAYPWGMGYYGYYHQVWVPVVRPGYVRTDHVVTLETRVFAVGSKKLIWAGNVESFNPDSPEKVVRGLARLVVSDMKKSGLME